MAITLVAVCVHSLDVLEVGLALDALHAGLPALPPGLLDDPSRRERINRSLADAEWREDACALLEDPAVLEAAQAFVDGCHRVVGSCVPDSMLDPSWLEAVQEAYSRSEELGELGEALLNAIEPSDDEELGEEPAVAPPAPEPAPQAPPAPTWERPIVSTAVSFVAICTDSPDLVETSIALDALHAGLPSLPNGMLAESPERRERIDRSLADAEWREDTRALLDDPVVMGTARSFVECCYRLVGSRPADPLSDPSWMHAVRGAYSRSEMLREMAEAMLFTLDPTDEEEDVEELRDEEEPVPPVAHASPGDVAIAAQVIVKLTDVTHVERYGLTLGVLDSGIVFEQHPAVVEAARIFLRACGAVAPPKDTIAEALRDSTWLQFLRWGFETGSALKALADAFLRTAAAAYGTMFPWGPAPDATTVASTPERERDDLPRSPSPARRVPMAATPWRAARARRAPLAQERPTSEEAIPAPSRAPGADVVDSTRIPASTVPSPPSDHSVRPDASHIGPHRPARARSPP